MLKRRVLLASVGASLLVLVSIVATTFGKKARCTPQELYARLIPAWQIFRAEEWRHAASPAAIAMLNAAQAWPALAKELRVLDEQYPDDVLPVVARANQAARAAGLPYWLEVQTVRGRPILLSHFVARVHRWRSVDRQFEVLYLSRLDNINVEIGLIGQASSNGPLVFLDRIEDDLLDDLSRSSDTNAAAVDRIGRSLLAGTTRELTQASTDRLLVDLNQRRALFEIMQNRMKVVVPHPVGLIWSERWFDRIEAMTKFGNGRGPLVFDSDLRAVREANEALRQPGYVPTVAALIDLRARAVEAHEARHAADSVFPPMPDVLQAWEDPAFADQINKELRAYLGELHDAPDACPSMVAVVRAAYSPKARPTPHLFAGRLIAEGLGGKSSLDKFDSGNPDASLRAILDNKISGLDPVAFMRDQCASAPSKLRGRVLELWQKLYGETMPELHRTDGGA